MELVFATNNKNKLREAEGILPEEILLLNLDDIGCEEELPETADTLVDNALMKARFVKEMYGCDCFADDTGLEVEVLNNAPGVYSARYAGEPSDPEKNMDKLLKEMQGQPNRKARFVTQIALLIDAKEYLFEGAVEGHILEERQGSRGFGYDPLFVPDGYTTSFAEMTAADKNAISHRGRALKKMQAFLLERGASL